MENDSCVGNIIGKKVYPYKKAANKSDLYIKSVDFLKEKYIIAVVEHLTHTRLSCVPFCFRRIIKM